MSEPGAKLLVTEKAQRPARMDGACFYCLQPIGQSHKADCVLVKKKVRIRMTVEYDIEVPADWGKDMIEFHRNESSWCADNAVEELSEAFDDCLCNHAKFECVGDVDQPAFLSE